MVAAVATAGHDVVVTARFHTPPALHTRPVNGSSPARLRPYAEDFHAMLVYPSSSREDKTERMAALFFAFGEGRRSAAVHYVVYRSTTATRPPYLARAFTPERILPEEASPPRRRGRSGAGCFVRWRYEYRYVRVV